MNELSALALIIAELKLALMQVQQQLADLQKEKEDAARDPSAEPAPPPVPS